MIKINASIVYRKPTSIKIVAMPTELHIHMSCFNIALGTNVFFGVIYSNIQKFTIITISDRRGTRGGMAC